MSFLYPAFFFALFTVLIPVIIHLFNFRTYKTVYFSNVQFLKNLKQETKSKSKLKHLLILLMRILAITALVTAFTQPYIPKKNQNSNISQNYTCIYIDNSFSTEAESKYGKILETEKNKAFEIANAYPEDTKFLFLSNDFKLKHQHFVSKEQFKDFVSEVKTSPVFKKTSFVIQKIKNLINKIPTDNKNFSVYLISDFQKTSADISQIKTDSSQNIIFVPVLSEKTANLFIDSVWFDKPYRPVNQQDKINVNISNNTNDNLTQMPLKLYINDSLKSTGSFNIEAHSHTTESITFINDKRGIVNGKVEITDFPITYDNRFYFNYNLTDTVKILIVRENSKTNKFINAVFSGLNYASLKTVSANNIQSINFNKFDVIISDGLKQINNLLKENFLNFCNNGGILLIFPVINCNTDSYNIFFNEADLNYITGFDTSRIEAEKINYHSEILKNIFKKKEKNIDMPILLKRVLFSDLTNIDEEVLLYSEKNDKLISSGSYGKGTVFTFAQSADDSYGNLVYHPLWVSLLYNMVFFNSSGKTIYYTIGTDYVIQIKNPNDKSDNPFHILNSNGTIDIIPQLIKSENSISELFINNTIQKAGHYKIMSENKTVGGISLNYNRNESDLKHYSLKDLEKYSSESTLQNISVLDINKDMIQSEIMNQNQGIQLQKLFLILALLFILSEILFIKFLK